MSVGLRTAAILSVVTAFGLSGFEASAAPQSHKPRPPARRAAQSPAPVGDRDLRGEDDLVRVYDAMLDARFDQVDAELARACGPAPREACDVLAATAIWWRILLDPESRALDETFAARVERAIKTTDAWTKRAPKDAEAWFYRGGAYAARVQWKVLRNEKLAAARDGKRIKQALERAIELDPSLDDAYFGIGLYKYYADVAPTAAKFLRFLLLLPGGDREEGLAEMLRAREHGRLLQGEADYQLHIIYLWYERDPGRALEILQALGQHYPGNPLFPAQVAGIEDTYQHDITASLGSWRQLLAMAREQRVNAAALAEVQARLGIARQLEALCQTDHAIEQLEAIVALRPAAPYSSLALAYLRLGEAHDRLGERGAATEAYRLAAAEAPDDDPFDIREEAADRLRHAPDSRLADGYRLSLQGWRRLERQDLEGAAAALEQSLVLNPEDAVARYRFGRVLQARHDDAAALDQFARAIDASRAAPAPILANAYLDAARLHERAGDRAQALASYRRAATLFGAAAETRTAAARAIARLEKPR